MVAEGVETPAELAACREIGCDLVQGFLIARPQTDPAALAERYADIADNLPPVRRAEDSDVALIRERIEQLPALREDDDMRRVFDCFKRHSEHSHFPVLDAHDRPLGLICEHRLKTYIYSSVAYVSRVLDIPGPRWMLAYLDFDHFKPFNDSYGFRQGDRAITLFADLLRKQLPRGGFAGHIGGDDFFAGVEGLDAPTARALIDALLGAFAHQVQSFYDAEARTRGWISSRDRTGKPTRYPLLRCSAAVVVLPSGPRSDDLDALARRIAVLKKRAKAAEDGISLLDLGATRAGEQATP